MSPPSTNLSSLFGQTDSGQAVQSDLAKLFGATDAPAPPSPEPTVAVPPPAQTKTPKSKAKKTKSQRISAGDEGDSFDPSTLVHESLLSGVTSIEETIRHRRRRQRGEAADGEDEELEAEDELVAAKGRKALARKPRSGKPERGPEDPTKNARTLFVGNVPVACLEKAEFKLFKALFREHGEIESLRFRSIALPEPMPRKVAYTQKRIHNERDVLNVYIVYKEKAAVKAAVKAKNGTLFLEKHLRVDRAEKKSVEKGQVDHRRSVFVGNLAFDVEEEAVWKHFEGCGQIVNVRVIRDKQTNLGKGFGYVLFSDRPAVHLALQMNGMRLGKRALRVATSSERKLAQKAVETGKDTSMHPAERRKRKRGQFEESGGKFEGERAERQGYVAKKLRKESSGGGRTRKGGEGKGGSKKGGGKKMGRKVGASKSK
ncbi:hypothetical protein BJ684DRAFT_16986 [Piptocephalis cylindrospora]|uniref:Nucleolar protein 12 n=1 Tax=Piptocephalis cylindrospora TaxID=1907219 RepID=A0A4P9Y197_9FUNG|nr:hypothetical protein BJ684DRAFT_16986 [Piptocephalis cylindrospora]|eukprot:RKP12533.1 hypothetical protein BJ684DRAFT_16986 [Piptocephalis cylindrospora]